MMFYDKQEQISDASGSGRIVWVGVVLVVLLLLSGAVTTVQAQKMSGTLTWGELTHTVNPQHHTPYYLPSYDMDRWLLDYFYYNFRVHRRGRGYDQGSWYPWSFRWGRYDVPNSSWWSFGEGFYDEYGTGSVWTAGEPVLRTELKAIQTIEREMQATRASQTTKRATHYRGTRSSGISASRGGSKGSSGGSGSSGSSGGGGSIGSSGGGGGSTKGGKK